MRVEVGRVWEDRNRRCGAGQEPAQDPTLDWLRWSALSMGFPGMSINEKLMEYHSADYIAWLWGQYPHS